jgi:integrase
MSGRAPVHPPVSALRKSAAFMSISGMRRSGSSIGQRRIPASRTPIPVPEVAAELIESIKPNSNGWFFPSATDPTKPVSRGTLYSFMWRQREREVIPVVTNRDLRRTWKTLAGKAGLSKEIRDRLQNHTLQDVSSKSYDRWNYMREKRTTMKKWNAFARALPSKKRLKSIPALRYDATEEAA